MKCKNKEIIVQGMVYYNDSNQIAFGKLHCICTNDEKGKSLSIGNSLMQFTIPFEPIAECFEGDYKNGT